MKLSDAYQLFVDTRYRLFNRIQMKDVMKLSEAYELFIDARYGLISAWTRDFYVRCWGRLIAYLGDVPVESVTLQDLRQYRRYLLERNTKYEKNHYRPPEHAPLSPSTVHSLLRGIRVVFNWLVEEEVIAKSPAVRLELPKRPEAAPKAISQEDILRIIGQARISKLPERDTAVVMALADTGCRVGGIAGLRLQDIELDENRATVKEKGQAGGKRRYVYFSDATVQALDAWLHVRPSVAVSNIFITLCPSHPGPVGGACTACRHRHKPMGVNSIRLLIKRLGKRAGVSGPHGPHSFRHSAARSWIENGADLSQVSQMLGHTTIEVTANYYARWTKNELGKVHAKVSIFKEVSYENPDPSGPFEPPGNHRPGQKTDKGIKGRGLAGQAAGRGRVPLGF